MDFAIEFNAKDIIEARKITSKSDEFFVFNKGTNKKQLLDLQLSFLFSKKVQDLIRSDQTTISYTIPDEICTDDFFDYFLTSIETNVVHVEKNQIKDFVSLVEALKVECINPKIDTAIISLLCEQFNSEQFSNDQERYNFLCHNLDNIDMNTLKSMPETFIYRLISNSIFQNDDDRAKFLLNNPEFFITEFIQYINFDKLSKPVLNEVISKLNFDLSGLDRLIYDKLIKRYQTELSIVDINVLIIIIGEHAIAPTWKNIDFTFIDYLNGNDENRNYRIHYKTILNTKFNTKSGYMNLFDVVVIGGCDSYSAFKPGIKKQEIDEYHNKGGIILLLHDVVYGEMGEILKPLVGLMGYTKQISERGCSNEVHLKESCDKKDVLSVPFKIESPIKVALTHRTPEYADPNYYVLVDENNLYYYVENLDEHVADCIMGHSHDIKESEQKLFYNLICHLYNFCHGLQVKTKI